MTEPLETHCARCLKAAPPERDRSIEWLEWEVLDDGTVVCPDCLTPEEKQAIDESDMDLMDHLGIDDET
jgi:hypothetical protein